ncbi:MAG: hypothetical protein FIB08_14990 [Candidatus Methanoperedens sp.]|nr:hypothetical protein [Candidatus Methanoperedens sp.]
MRKEEGIRALKIGLLTIKIILLLECPSATSLKPRCSQADSERLMEAVVGRRGKYGKNNQDQAFQKQKVKKFILNPA